MSDCTNDMSGKYDNQEYRERIKMKLKQIIGDRSFNNLIKDAVKELLAESGVAPAKPDTPQLLTSG